MTAITVGCDELAKPGFGSRSVCMAAMRKSLRSLPSSRSTGVQKDTSTGVEDGPYRVGKIPQGKPPVSSDEDVLRRP